jgi:hypothetical protein
MQEKTPRSRMRRSRTSEWDRRRWASVRGVRQARRSGNVRRARCRRRIHADIPPQAEEIKCPSNLAVPRRCFRPSTCAGPSRGIAICGFEVVQGGPLGFGNQVLISSHRKLLRSKAVVVSVAEKPGHDPGRRSREASASEPLQKCRKRIRRRQNRGVTLPPGSARGNPEVCPSGIRHVGGAKLDQAFVRNVRTYTAMRREKAQAAPIARPKVPMRRIGADCFVVAEKRGNARGSEGSRPPPLVRVNRQRESRGSLGRYEA